MRSGQGAALPNRQNCSAESGSAARPRDPYLPGIKGRTAMNLALGLMSFGFTVTMAIPLVGPMLLQAF